VRRLTIGGAVVVLLPAMVVVTYLVLHAAPVVPAHPVLHTVVDGVLVPTDANPVLHPVDIPFPTAVVIPIPLLTATLLAATAVAHSQCCCFIPTSSDAIGISVLAALSTTIVSLAIPDVTFLPSGFFGTFSSTSAVFLERSKHLVFFKKINHNKVNNCNYFVLVRDT
jgi:hypothetical protein